MFMYNCGAKSFRYNRRMYISCSLPTSTECRFLASFLRSVSIEPGNLSTSKVYMLHQSLLQVSPQSLHDSIPVYVYSL